MIILLDVDGTLVDHQAQLPGSASKAVRRAVGNGHQVYLCTGRARAEVQPELWGLGIHGMIGGNGCYVESRGQVIHHQVLDAAVVGRAVDWLFDQGLDFYLECNSGLLGTRNLLTAIADLFEGGASEENLRLVTETLGSAYGALEDTSPGAPWRRDVNKISFRLREDVDMGRLASEFDGLAKIDDWSLTGRGPEFGEFGQFGVHKGAAVELLARHLGAGREDLIGFGDARSDIELLQACGTGVAMGQAPAELKAVATLVTDHVDHDGLANAFTRLGLN